MEHLHPKRKITIMIAIMAAMLFSSINQTIVGTALPRIIAVLGGMDYYTWVFTIYMLTSSITTILVGKLSDLYGRKPFILLGIGIFTLGSFLSGTSTDIIQLILYRAIQGIGAGMILSTSFSAIGDLFPPRERGKWMGLMSASFGVASVLGPTLGGYIVDHAAWHWVFWVFLPLGIVAFLMILLLFPKVERKASDPPDYLGSIFLTLTLVPLLLAFSWAGTKYTWGSAPIISLFAGSIVSLLLFLLVESKVKSPVIPLVLFRNPIFTISNTSGFIIGAGMFGAIMYVPYFIQGVLGYSATASSYVTMPMTLSLVAGSALSGQLTSRLGKYKALALTGLIVMGLGLLLMHRMDLNTQTHTIVINMIVVGLGLGLALPIFSLAVQNAVEQKFLGVATSSAQFIRSLGGTVGVSVMGTVLAHRLKMKLTELSAASGNAMPNLDPQQAKSLEALKNPQILLDPGKLKQLELSLPPELHDTFVHLITTMKVSLDYALSGVFLTASIVVVGAVVLTLFLKEIPLRTSNESMKKNEAESAFVASSDATAKERASVQA